MIKEITFKDLLAEEDSIKAMASAIPDTGNPSAARALRQHCEHLRSRLGGKFGDVAEQLTRVASSAKALERSHHDRTAAILDLVRNTERLTAAISLHGGADQDCTAPGTLSLPLEVWDKIKAAPSPVGPLRRWRGETIESLAAKSGLSVSALVEIEASKQRDCNNDLKAVARALRVHADDLLPDDE